MTESLITKYRPKTFNEVIGHKQILSAIQNTLAKNLAHSFIFCGPPGTGKTTLARIIANEVGCRNPVEVDGATATGIDAMREITSTLMYSSLTGEAKVIIVDEAHKLSEAAKTSLLKSIEEPGSHVYWILATTELTKISKAIQTRCQVYTLNDVSETDIFTLLSRVCKSEGFEPPEEVLEVVLESAHGSPRQALSLLAACSNCTSRKDALVLIGSLHEAEGGEIVDLARYLVKNTTYSWTQMQRHVTNLQDENPESIRLMLVNYLSKVIINAKNPSEAARLLSILSAFKDQYHSAEKFAPLLLSLGDITFG